MSYLDYCGNRRLIELASYDDADSYEVDMGGIYYDKDSEKFVFASASGCSCWDGDWSTYEYNKLGDLAKDLVDGDEDGNDIFCYQPGLQRGIRLIEQAKAEITKGILEKPVMPNVSSLEDVVNVLNLIVENSFTAEDYRENIRIMIEKIEKNT